MTACPHFDTVLVGGRCYYCLKLAALNGGRSKLSREQLNFCGFDIPTPPNCGWRSADALLPASDGTEDGDPEARRGLMYTMRRGSHRLELEV